MRLAIAYRYVPRVSIPWRDVWVGAAASLAGVLLWVYYSAQIFLLGAEFTWVYAHKFGSRKKQAELPTPPEPTRSTVSLPR